VDYAKKRIDDGGGSYRKFGRAMAHCLCWLGAAVLLIATILGCDPSIRDRVVPQATVPQIVNIDDAEQVCAELLGVDGYLVAGFTTGCEVQKWVGDTLVTFKVLGTPLVPPLDDDGTWPTVPDEEPIPEPERPNPHEDTPEEDQPCERHREMPPSNAPNDGRDLMI
jgi:hypothetical protein